MIWLRALALLIVLATLSRSVEADHNINTQTKFGTAYFLWHCLTKNRPIHDISEWESGRQPLGPVPEFHWWGLPAGGYYCLSENDALLRSHAVELAEAGIDFVFVDFTNHDTLAYDRVWLEYLDPLSRLLSVWSRIPNAPKIVPFMQLTPGGNLHKELIRRLQEYPNSQFIYQGKPLLLIVGAKGIAIDAAERTQLDMHFSTRLMWDDGASAGTWMFISRCQPGFVEHQGRIPCNQRVAYRDGKVEQVSVSAAFQRDYMSDKATAAPRYHGRTFLQQMARLDGLGPVPIVTILGWNQWIAQRLCVKPGLVPDPACGRGSKTEVDGEPVFTDVFDQEYSSDFEPGGAMGDSYYNLLACEIHRRKTGGRTSCKLPN